MSAVEQMKTRHITSFKASSQGAKTKLRRKGDFFFSIATWFLKYPSKRTRVRVTSKENGQTGGAGGGGGGGEAITRGRRLIEERLLLGGIRHPPTVVHFKYRKGD